MLRDPLDDFGVLLEQRQVSLAGCGLKVREEELRVLRKTTDGHFEKEVLCLRKVPQQCLEAVLSQDNEGRRVNS